MAALRLAARWLVPVASAPIAGGAVLVGDDGRVAACGPDREVPRPAGTPALDLGDAAVLPGLVNAHSHLELTALRGLVRNVPFGQWVQEVRRLREALSQAQMAASARWGVLEGFAAGITTTGDTGSSGEPAAAMAALGARGVAFQEVFGPDPAQAETALRDLGAATEALLPLASDRLRIGVSPHAPYTVSAPLLAAVVELALRRGWPLAMHLAESHEEDYFVRHAQGPFADRLRARGIAVRPHSCSPVAWARRTGLLDAAPLLIHCVTADGDDTLAIARHRATIAICPWSNAVLRNGRADLALFRRLGVTVGAGTDSVVPGGGLDPFREARVATLACPLTPREMLRLITADAAAALGLPGSGLLAPGSWGDICAVRLAGPAFAGIRDIEEAVAFGATAADVVFTAVAGVPVFHDGAWPGVDAAADRAAVVEAARTAAEATLATSASHRLSSAP